MIHEHETHEPQQQEARPSTHVEVHRDVLRAVLRAWLRLDADVAEMAFQRRQWQAMREAVEGIQEALNAE